MSGPNGDHPTFVGPGFGTLEHKRTYGTRRTPPAVISRRATLRDAMPAIYHETDFAMRFIEAMEEVLDPITAVLDALPAYFDPELAPRTLVDMLAAWLGVESDEAQELDARRRAVKQAAELGRRRGTARGLALALKLSFPDIPTRVVDEGGVRWSLDGRPGRVEEARCIVYVDQPVAEERQSAIARCIEREKPVHANYKLRVKSG